MNIGLAMGKTFLDEVIANGMKLHAVANAPINCRSGENVFYYDPKSTVCEIGPTSFSMGAMGSGFRPVAKGALFVTNQRIHFSGGGVVRDIAIGDVKIIDEKPDPDNVVISVKGQTKIMFSTRDRGMILLIVITTVLDAYKKGKNPLFGAKEFVNRTEEEESRFYEQARRTNIDQKTLSLFLADIKLYGAWYDNVLKTGQPLVLSNSYGIDLYEGEKIYMGAEGTVLQGPPLNGKKGLPEDVGVFLLTDLRICFKGKLTEYEIPIEEISTLHSAETSIEVEWDNKPTKLYFDFLMPSRIACSTLMLIVNHETPAWISFFDVNTPNRTFVRKNKMPSRLEKLKNPINESYIKAVDCAANELVTFIMGLDSRAEVVALINSLEGLSGADKISGFVFECRRLGYLVFEDVLTCYSRLGYSLEDLNSPEGVGLLVCLMKYFGHNLSDDELFTSEGRESLASWTKDAIDQIHARQELGEVENSTLLNYILSSDPAFADLSSKYTVLLYRFLSVVAKADGTISPSECECLSSMVKQSAGKILFSPQVGQVRRVGMAGSEGRYSSASSPLEELDGMIGLSSVKQEVLKLSNFIRIQKARSAEGMKTSLMSYHCVFTGSPGTGKTTIARILAGIYRDLGVLKQGHLIETDRSGLVGEYVGQTAVKTNKIIDSALDGVLFIDEAYSLVGGGAQDYGKEAIATLLKRMEDDRDRLVVVLAGYTEDMKRFIDTNPGLQSRFNRYIEFPDYSEAELCEIFESLMKSNQYEVTPTAKEKLLSLIADAVAVKDEKFGNGRFVRNLFEKAIERQASRLAGEESLTNEMLRTITEEDLV